AYGYAQAVHGSLPGQYRAAEVHARRIGNLVQIIMLLGPYCPFTLGSIMGYQQSRAQEGLRILGFRGMFMQESLAAHRLDDIVEHQVDLGVRLIAGSELYAEINAIFLEVHVADRVDDQYGELRILFVKVFQAGNQPFRGKGRVGMHAYLVVIAAFDNAVGGIGNLVESRNDAVSQFLSYIRQAYAPLFAPKQLHPQIFFQDVQLLADRRLANMKLFG